MMIRSASAIARAMESSVKAADSIRAGVPFFRSAANPASISPLISRIVSFARPVFRARVKAIALAAGTGWDVAEIEKQFYDYIKKKGAPKYLDRAFLGFVRKKIGSKP